MPPVSLLTPSPSHLGNDATQVKTGVNSGGNNINKLSYEENVVTPRILDQMGCGQGAINIQG